jgi:hypothetical protein
MENQFLLFFFVLLPFFPRKFTHFPLHMGLSFLPYSKRAHGFRDDDCCPKSGGGGLTISFLGGFTVNSACKRI